MLSELLPKILIYGATTLFAFDFKVKISEGGMIV